VIRYLLDTDTCSYIAKRSQPTVLERFAQLCAEDWAISAVTYAEILYGLEPWPLKHPLRIKAKAFLFSAKILDWPTTAAADYAAIRHSNRAQPLHDRDMMIAAHAIALDATLVTNNTRHFSRMGGGLRFENWLDR
jgi:tRNA(fMet)-specific endonuclease VapC